MPFLQGILHYIEHIYNIYPCRFVLAWFYYGIVLLTTSFLQYDPHCGMCCTWLQGMMSVIISFCTLHSEGVNAIMASNWTCEEDGLTPDDYIKIIWTSAAEIPGMVMGYISYSDASVLVSTR